MNFQSDYDDIKNEKTYYDEFDKIIDRNTLPELYKIVQELKKKNEELYNKKEVEEIVSEIRKVYKHRKKNLDCSSTDTYPCKTEYSHSYLAPGCGIGHDKITWFDDNPNEITVSQIKTKKAELDKIEETNAYKIQREKEYPLMQDQLDDIYHNGIDGWKKTIKAIKDKHPKG